MAQDKPLLTLCVNDYTVIIDEEDYPKLIKWGYSVIVSNDARLKVTRGKFRGKQIARLLLDAPPDKLVDHHNGNTLDARKDNLRLATHSQNNTNKLPPAWKLLPKGVSRRGNKFAVNVSVGYTTKYIGTYDTVEAADAKYKEVVQGLHGDYALHNRPK